MQIIPFRTGPESFNIFVVLEDANLERMRQADPAQLGLEKLPPQWHSLKLDTLIIGYANPKDVERMRDLMIAGDPGSALSYLSRGFKFDPARGDSDAKYDSLLHPDRGEHP